MLKKIIIVSICLLFNGICCFAEYTPIENKDKVAYKNEINKIINKQIHVSKKEIKKFKKEVMLEENPYIRTALIEQGTDSILFEFYTELINVTNKYTDVKSDIPATDWYGVLKEKITPYLDDNNVNTLKIKALENYANETKTELKNKYDNQ